MIMNSEHDVFLLFPVSTSITQLQPVVALNDYLEKLVAGAAYIHLNRESERPDLLFTRNSCQQMVSGLVEYS